MMTGYVLAGGVLVAGAGTAATCGRTGGVCGVRRGEVFGES